MTEAGPAESEGAGAWTLLAAALLSMAAGAVLGGASRSAPLNLAIVELTSLPLLFVGLRRVVAVGAWRSAAAPLVLLALLIALPLLQLIPLPPSIWTVLPGRDPLARALTAAGLPMAWRPLSLAPDETLRCALALVPPVAMFLAGLTLTPGQSRIMAGGWILLGLAGLALGAVQLTSPAYLYAEATRGTLTGFFANRNHEASLLLALIPLAAVGAAGAMAGSGMARAFGVVCALFLPLAIIGLAVIRSRAGVILCGPALLGALVLTWRASGGGRWQTALLAAGCLAAVAAVAGFGLSPIVQRFVGNGVAEARFEAWPHVIAAARLYDPVGAGVGSFERVYRQIEPLTLVTSDPLSHAHNELLEFWLEAGWAGLALAGAFGLWLVTALRRAWLGMGGEGGAVRAAAGLSVLLLLAHAMVDYGPRNSALAVLLAFSCGLLASAPKPGPRR